MAVVSTNDKICMTPYCNPHSLCARRLRPIASPTSRRSSRKMGRIQHESEAHIASFMNRKKRALETQRDTAFRTRKSPKNGSVMVGDSDNLCFTYDAGWRYVSSK